MSDIDTITAVAVAAARKAGAIQKEKYGGALNIDAKLVGDLKLEADRLCEKAIVDTIRESFPAHAVHAEESGRAEGAEYIWYVDPLDGTVNYYFGIPYFCTTLACYRQAGAKTGEDPIGFGEPVVGVTYAPLLDELFLAVAGRGATLNGAPIRVREEESLADAFVIVGIGNNPEKLAFTRDVTLKLSATVRKTRNLGACAYDLANVAAGRASGFFEYGVNPWDVAAGRILVAEAGGVTSVADAGNDRLVIVASGRGIHPELSECMAWKYSG